jgi:chaperonin GroEL
MQKALASPLAAIASNAGTDGEVATRKVLTEDRYEFGFDAQAQEFGNLVERGIVDPTKVIRTALQNAVSVAGIILTTDCLITEIPKKKKKMAGPPGGPGGPGMGGMGDMGF